MFTPEQRKMVALSSLGGALEYYDFVIFIFLANVLGQLFFPMTNPFAALMATLAVFAIGYLARPLGGLLFGHFGDRLGRKTPFIISAFLMALPTVLIGCLPTYKTAGIWASCLLVFLRFLQGLSLGGEVPGAVVFIAESVVQKRRGFATGLILFGVNMGMLAGSYMGAHLIHLLSAAQLAAWGWRIPFWLGGLLGILSYHLRKRMQETPIFNALTHQNKPTYPIKEIFLKHRMSFFRGAAIVALEAVMVSIVFLFMPTYLATFFHFSLEKMLTLNTLNIMAFSIPVLFASFLSDLWGRKKIMIFGASFLVFFSYPIFLLFGYHSYPLTVLALITFSLVGSCIAGVFPTMMVELFPTAIRYTGVALCYNFGFGIVGGLTPLLVMIFIHWSSNPYAASWILTVAAAVGLISLSFSRETYKSVLSESN